MAKNLAEMFKLSAEKYPNNLAFLTRNNESKYDGITFKDLYETGLNLAEALIELGVKARENVAILADNRLEWIISDYGVILCGAANVPRGTDITDSEIVYILNHSEAKIVFIENDKVLEKFNKNKDQLQGVQTIIMMDKASNATGTLKLNELIEKGKNLRNSGVNKVQERVSGIKEDDLFTLIYTSGTTGLPKGVMLMHSNMIHQAYRVLEGIKNIDQNARMLSILPIWHVFERVFEYMAIQVGASTYYTNVRNLKQDLTIVKPTFMASAPRLWENIYTGIYTKVNDPKQTPLIRRLLFKLAYCYSKQFNEAKRFLTGKKVDYTGRNIITSAFLGVKSIVIFLLTGPFTLSFLTFLLPNVFPSIACCGSFFYTIGGLGLLFNYYTLDKIVLSKIRAATGGELKASVSGGGALPGFVDEFFNNIGISVLEGYGMTETSPVISVRTFDRLVIGSVGPIANDTTVQIRDTETGAFLTEIDHLGNVKGTLGKKGVVFIKGPQVMKGYFKNEEATKKAIIDGWMNTGDMGMINFKKTLTLTGRAKDTIVLLGGENVEPVPVENKLQESPLVSQCMLVGQDQKNLGVLIIPDFEKLKEWCKENGVEDQPNNQLIENEKVKDLYKKEVKSIVSSKNGFKSFEQISAIELISKPFEVGDEITNLFKLKRHIITEKYKDKIQKMYK